MTLFSRPRRSALSCPVARSFCRVSLVVSCEAGAGGAALPKLSVDCFEAPRRFIFARRGAVAFVLRAPNLRVATAFIKLIP